MSNAGKKIEVINYPLPGTDKQVPIQMDEVKAEPGHFLGIGIIFADWNEARNAPVDQALIFSQLVGARKRPCYMHDYRFDEYDKCRAIINMYKAEEKRDAKRSDELSLDAFLEDGYEPDSGYDTTEAEAIVSSMREELDRLLEQRDKRLLTVSRLSDEGYKPKEISERTSIPLWTFYDLMKRIREVKEKFRNEL